VAAIDLSGFNGNVTLPSTHGGAPIAWSLRAVQRKKDISRYGGNRFATQRGGIIDFTGTIRVALRKGAASTAPGATALEADGAALTLTAETGCTYSGTALMDFSMDHANDDPAIEGTYDYVFTGTVTETWVVS
jgi:hypothetical protein